jgi:DNA-binding SARP family transcriptional activator
MIRLRLLGSQQLERDGGELLDAVVAQPKRFALLAYLALAGGAFVRRDTVLAVFWPDLDQFAARRALRNTVYQLRRALGADVIRARGDEEVGVDVTLLWCDVTALGEAAQSGQHEEAVAFYRGELMPGFHLPGGAEEFESWLLQQREQVSRQVLHALEALIAREERAGHPVDAARWSARAQEMAPYDEGWVRRTMTLLATGGNRGSALLTYDAFARRLKEEMGSSPTAETSRLAVRLRTEIATLAPSASPGNVLAPATAAPDSPPTSLPPAATSLEATGPPPAPAATSRVAPPPTYRRRWSRRTWAVSSIAAVTIIGALLGVTAWRRGRARADPHRLVVAVFRNRTGDPRLESVGDMAADWVTRGLFATGIGEVVDPGVLVVRGRGPDGRPADPMQLARLTGAGTIVEGQYYRSGDSLLFAASIVNANSGRIAGQVGPVGGPIARPAAALDDLRSRVMTALSIALDPRFAERAPHGVEPPPFPAYDDFIRGWDAFSGGDPRRAEQFFREAVRRDTVFAQAAVALATASANADDCALTDSLARAWPPARPGLTEADRLTLAIAVAHCGGDNDDRLRLTLARARLMPRSSFALLSSGIAALWADRPAEALSILRDVDPAIDLAWMPDSGHYRFFDALAEADHRLGRYADELVVAARVRPVAPLGGTWLRARALTALGRRGEALQAVDSMLSLPAEPAAYWGLVSKTPGRPEYSATGGWAAAWIAREFFAHGDSVTGRLVAARARAWAEHRNVTERATPELRFLEATTRDLEGDYTGARVVLDSLLTTDTANVDIRGLLAGAAAGAGDTAAAAAGDRWLAHLDEAHGAWAAPLYRARIASREGRLADAVTLMRAVRAAGGWPLWVHCDPAIFSLRARADYQALMAPRG